jgi:hypothetical protein
MAAAWAGLLCPARALQLRRLKVQFRESRPKLGQTDGLLNKPSCESSTARSSSSSRRTSAASRPCHPWFQLVGLLVLIGWYWLFGIVLVITQRLQSHFDRTSKYARATLWQTLYCNCFELWAPKGFILLDLVGIVRSHSLR